MVNVKSIDWTSRASSLDMPSQAFINGKNIPALSGKTTACINPANGQRLAEVADCGPDDADITVEIAREVFEAGTWSQLAPAERKTILLRWADLIEQHQEELALLESLNAGKPISDTCNADVPSAINTIRWTAEATDKVYEQIAPTGHDTLALVTRLPLGVVTAIIPWNYPLSTTAWKLAPALATGNWQLGDSQARSKNPTHCAAHRATGQ